VRRGGVEERRECRRKAETRGGVGRREGEREGGRGREGAAKCA
jgi:hypothetical protein